MVLMLLVFFMRVIVFNFGDGASSVVRQLEFHVTCKSNLVACVRCVVTGASAYVG